MSQETLPSGHASNDKQLQLYPQPIAPEKIPKAVRLYSRFLTEQGIEKRTRISDITGKFQDSHRNSAESRADSISTSISIGSASHRDSAGSRADSITTSLSLEVVSFEPTPQEQSEPTGFDGKPMKIRRLRKTLSPLAKAKAALVRHLGACSICRPRRVPCRIEHHDISILEKSLNENGKTNPAVAAPEQPWRPRGLLPDNDKLIGLGGNSSLLGLGGIIFEPWNNQLDVQSPGIVDPNSAHYPLASQNAPWSQYSPWPYRGNPDGQTIVIGVGIRGYFYCSFLSGVCTKSFLSTEALYSHFEVDHFPITRIEPAERLVCSNCQVRNNSARAPCCNCGSSVSIQPWIYASISPMPLDPQLFYPDALPFNQISRNHYSTPRTMPITQGAGSSQYQGSNNFQGAVYGGSNNFQTFNTHTRNPSVIPYSINCTTLIIIMLGFIGLSCFLGIFFTVHKEYGYSMGDSFTLAGFVIAVGTLVCSFLLAFHYPRCECWKKKRQGTAGWHLDQDGIPMGDMAANSHGNTHMRKHQA